MAGATNETLFTNARERHNKTAHEVEAAKLADAVKHSEPMVGGKTGRVVAAGGISTVATSAAAIWLSRFYAQAARATAEAQLLRGPGIWTGSQLAGMVTQETRIPMFGPAIAGATLLAGMSWALHEHLFPSEPSAGGAAKQYLVAQPTGVRYEAAPPTIQVVPTPTQEKATKDLTAQANAQKSAAAAASLAAGMGVRRRTPPDFMAHESAAQKRQAAAGLERERARWGDYGLEGLPSAVEVR